MTDGEMWYNTTAVMRDGEFHDKLYGRKKK